MNKRLLRSALADILPMFMHSTLQEIQSYLDNICDIQADCYQIESLCIESITRRRQSSFSEGTFNIYLSGDYVVSNTTRDKEFFTITHRVSGKLTTIAAKLSDIVKLYPITDIHTRL